MEENELLNIITETVNEYHPDWSERDKKMIALYAFNYSLHNHTFTLDVLSDLFCDQCGTAEWLIEQSESVIVCLNCGQKFYILDDSED